MVQQEEVSAAGSNVSFRLVLAQEARASLEAVREAQEAARLRARRQTRQARLWFVTSMAAAALAIVSGGPRVSRWWHARAHATPVVAPTVVAAPSSAPAPVAAPAAPEPAAGAPKAAAPVAAASMAVADEGCDTTEIRTAPWRLSAEGCARAFARHPNDATLALAVAHAEHAHAHLDEAAQWAKRALALDPTAAEAYVMIARADAAAGRHDDARTAYRKYLDLAPRGWHQGEARTALRRH